MLDNAFDAIEMIASHVLNKANLSTTHDEHSVNDD